MAVIRKTKNNKKNKNNKTKKHVKKYNKSRKIQRGGSEKAAGKPGKPGKSSKWARFKGAVESGSSWVSSKFSSGANAVRNKFSGSQQLVVGRKPISFTNPLFEGLDKTGVSMTPLLKSENASENSGPKFAASSAASPAAPNSPLKRRYAIVKRSTRQQSTPAFGLPRRVVGMTNEGFKNLRQRVSQTLSATRTPNNINKIARKLGNIKDQLYTILPSGARQLKPLNEIGDKITSLANLHGLGDTTALHRALGAGTTNFVKLLREQQTALAADKESGYMEVTGFKTPVEEDPGYLTIGPSGKQSTSKVAENVGYVEF